MHNFHQIRIWQLWLDAYLPFFIRYVTEDFSRVYIWYFRKATLMPLLCLFHWICNWRFWQVTSLTFSVRQVSAVSFLIRYDTCLTFLVRHVSDIFDQIYIWLLSSESRFILYCKSIIVFNLHMKFVNSIIYASQWTDLYTFCQSPIDSTGYVTGVNSSQVTHLTFSVRHTSAVFHQTRSWRY